MQIHLFDPTRTATQLRNGMPQQSALQQEDMQYFSFRMATPSCDSQPATCVDNDAIVAVSCAENAANCGPGKPLGEMDTCAAAGRQMGRPRL